MTSSKIVFRKPGYHLATSRLGQPGHGGGTLGYIYGPGHGGGSLSCPFSPGHGGGTLGYPYSPGHGGGPLSIAFQSTPQPRHPVTSGTGVDSRVITLGYMAELPDFRDVKTSDIAHHRSMSSSIQQGPNKANSYLLSVKKSKGKQLPAAIDLRNDIRDRNYFTPVEDQGELGSCTANAVIGLVEYLIKAEANQTINLSRLFLYKVTRNLMNQTGDQGAHIRTTIKALKMFGCPPEERWPYSIETFDYEPDAFLYSIARNFKAIRYLRLDNPGESGDKVLLDVKSCIADGYPAAFGFPVYSSIGEVSESNDVIPFPNQDDELQGGHAILAIGYDDKKDALLIRNSWGDTWGNKGYAWLPYEYVTSGIARDFWTILATDWVALADFG